MTILACVLTVTICGKPQIMAMSGELLSETTGLYLADFSHAASFNTGIQGDLSRIYVDKDLCVKETK